MSKRGAGFQLSKEGGFLGDGSNQLSDDDKPRQATAAQIAARKIRPLKSRRAASTTSNSFPGASQPAPGTVGGNPFGGFAPAPSSNGFSFNFGGPPSSRLSPPSNDAMDTSVSPQKQPVPSSFTQSTPGTMQGTGSTLFGNFGKQSTGNIFGQAPSSSDPFQSTANTSTAAPSTQSATSLFGSNTNSIPDFSFNAGISQSQSKAPAPPANDAPSQSFNFTFGQSASNAPFQFGAPSTSKENQEASTGGKTAPPAPSTSEPGQAFSFNASSFNASSAPNNTQKSASPFSFSATNPGGGVFSLGAQSTPKPNPASDQPDGNKTAAVPTFSLPKTSASTATSDSPLKPFSFSSTTGNSAGSTNAFSPATPAPTSNTLFGSTTPAPSFTPSKASDAVPEPKNEAKPASAIAAGASKGFNFNPSASATSTSTGFGNLFSKSTAPTTGTSTANNLFGNMSSQPSLGANNIFAPAKSENKPQPPSATSASAPGDFQKAVEPKPAPVTSNFTKPASSQASGGNIFAAAEASKPAKENSDSSVAKTTQPASSIAPTEQVPSQHHEVADEDDDEVDPITAWFDLNRFFKRIVAEGELQYDMRDECLFYLKQRQKIRKRLGVARSDDLLEDHIGRKAPIPKDMYRQNGTAAASSSKKPEQAANQDSADGVAGSQTANIFSSIVNKSSQPSAVNGTQSQASGSSGFSTSGFNGFGASFSKTPVKSAASLGTSTSTTPAGSPVKRDLFPAQTPSKSAPLGQLGDAGTPKPFDAGAAKRKSIAMATDDAEGKPEEGAQEKRQKVETNGGLRPPSSSGLFGAQSRSPTPVSSANNGSVLNSGAASPNPNNIFGHLSQDESNGKDDDDDDDEEDEDGEVDETPSTSTSTQEPKSGGLFERITKDDSGKPAFGTPSAKGNDISGLAQTGPVNKTWSGDSESPIKFSTPQPASSAPDESKRFNPFAGLKATTSTAPPSGSTSTPFNPFASLKTATSAAPPSGGVTTPFKFNPTPATNSDSGSVFGTASSSRAATPALASTGASEADDDETPAPVDKEQIKLRTALTDEDRLTYEVLFETDDKAVSWMRLVDKTEEELKADPKKQPKKWTVVAKGPLRVLKHKERGGGSILLKAEPLGRAVINTRLSAKLMYKRAKPKFAMFSMPLEDGKLSTEYLKFDEDSDCIKFVETCESNKS